MSDQDEHVEDTQRVQDALRGRPATVDDLINKPRRHSQFTVPLTKDDQLIELTMRYLAISSTEYDALVSAHAPTPSQKRAGAAYNIDTFAPALIAAVSLEPKLTVEQAGQIYHSPNWSGGEISALFIEALKLCNAGFDVPFTAAD